MTTAGVRELRQDASGVLRRVEEGERVRPTWRSVAELVALFPGLDDPVRDEDMALVDGAVTDPFERGTRRGADPRRERPDRRAGADMLEDLAAEAAAVNRRPRVAAPRGGDPLGD